jgi:putative two-component system response regulator
MEAPLQKKTILVVDDLPENIDLLHKILSPTYRLKAALNGEKALVLATSQDTPDLILLDVKMPGMDGYEVCRRLKASAVTSKIPVIFVTAMTDRENEAMGFDVGAVDYITKPVSPPIVIARVATHLALYDQNRVLEEKVRERTDEVAHVRDVTIHGMAVLAETRDNETGNHIMRTKNYVHVLAKRLMTHPRFRDQLDKSTVELLFKSAPLHDVGKVGIVDDILLKPGKLTLEEFEEMKNHTIYGRDAITRAEEALGNDKGVSFLRIAREITISHHEKWDGTGYPLRLSGEDIPVSGRIMAVADVYDALISKRVYKPAMAHEEAVRIIVEGDGRTTPEHFDPDVLSAFMDLNEKFREIAAKFTDRT